MSKTIFIATRGSALALAQANMVLAQCRQSFPELSFELKIIKTTGDKLQTASMSRIDASLPRGLFTKELEVALADGSADLAVHSLKDLPTELPPGLKLGAVTERADVRDVLIYRDAKFFTGENGGRARCAFNSNITIKDLPPQTTVATSSTRRKAQLLAQRRDLNVVEIRGNVATRLEKLADNPDLHVTVLAAAGLGRLNFTISPNGQLNGDAVPRGLLATILPLDDMLPCVGQGAIGLEIRENDERIAAVCERLNHGDTFASITAERSFLSAMGGGCQAPLGAHAQIIGDRLRLRVVSFLTDTVERQEIEGTSHDAALLGQQLAAKFKRV